jgi:NAD(P)H-binding
VLTWPPPAQIIQGEMSDLLSQSSAIGTFSVVISLLGPKINDRNIDPAVFARYYNDSVFPLMRQRGVHRIIAMGTISIVRAEDHWTFFQSMVTVFMRLFAKGVYNAIHQVADTFVTEARDLDWTLFRIASIPGDSDEVSWRKDREGFETFVGWIGEKGWTSSVRRAALARWLVDTAEDGGKQWVQKMPAISQLAGWH